MLPDKDSRSESVRSMGEAEVVSSSRKPYVKPLVQVVALNSKSDVLGTNCFTSSNTSQQTGGCKPGPVPAPCFN